MTTSGLAMRPRGTPPSVSRPERKVPVPSRPPPPPRRSFERILAWSVALSIAVHILLLLLSPLFITTQTPRGELAPTAAVTTPRFGAELIIPIPSENAPDTPVPDEVAETQPAFTAPPAQPSTPAVGATSPPAPGPQQPSGTGTTRDALQPGYRDSRLYVRPSPLPSPDTRTEHEQYMEHFQARIDALNDSMAVAAARNSRTSEWTVTDGSGNRWGLSPDGLHLGGITVPRALLPLPAATGDNQRLGEERERQRQRDEIQAQEDARERREIQNERNEAARER